MAPVVIEHPIAGRVYINERTLAREFLSRLTMPPFKLSVSRATSADTAADSPEIFRVAASDPQASEISTPAAFVDECPPNCEIQSAGEKLEEHRPEFTSANELAVSSPHCQIFDISTPVAGENDADEVTYSEEAPGARDDEITCAKDVCQDAGLRKTHCPDDVDRCVLFIIVLSVLMSKRAPQRISLEASLPEVSPINSAHRNQPVKHEGELQGKYCDLFCDYCGCQLGPDDPSPCFPHIDPTRECRACMQINEEEMHLENACWS